MAVALTAITGFAQEEPPVIKSPVWDFLTQGSNYVFATYGIYNATSESFGGGIGAGYKLSEFVVPTLRLDYINHRFYVPSGSLQLQVPVTVLGKVRVTPFAFSGIATLLNAGSGDNGNVIGIFGLGGSISLVKGHDKWYVPDYLLFDYEKWTGGGFNDDQYRFGVGFRF